jgi:hypothetical protein
VQGTTNPILALNNGTQTAFVQMSSGGVVSVANPGNSASYQIAPTGALNINWATGQALTWYVNLVSKGSINQYGTMTLNPDAGQPGLLPGTDGGPGLGASAQAWNGVYSLGHMDIYRRTPATQAESLYFRSGLATDAAVYRPANSDAVVIGFSGDGVAFNTNNQFNSDGSLAFIGPLTITSTTTPQLSVSPTGQASVSIIGGASGNIGVISVGNLGQALWQWGAGAGDGSASLNAYDIPGAVIRLSLSRTTGTLTLTPDAGAEALQTHGPVDIYGAPGTDRALYFTSNGSPRWQFKATAEAETGSNAGSNLEWHRYSDASGDLGSCLTVNRATGTLTLSPQAGQPAIVTTAPITTPRINAGSGQNLTLAPDGTGALTYVTPPNDNGTHLGHPNYRWSNIYGNNLINVSGQSIQLGAGGNIVYQSVAGQGHDWYVGSTRKMYLSQAGTLTIVPDGGQPSIVVSNGGPIQVATGELQLYALATGAVRVGNPSQNVIFYPPVGGWYPNDNGVQSLGTTGNKWSTVYAATGTINTSSVEAKTDIAPLDPAACVQAVLDTDWVRFHFRDPQPAEDADADARAAHVKMLEETAHVRAQNGYVLNSPDHKVSDLFGLADRQSGTPQSDLGIIACALQAALKRIAELEAKVN